MEESVISPAKVSCLEDEELDPRVRIELESLNAATDEINRLESTLEDANNAFRASLNETSTQLQVLSKKLGGSVEKARPFYEAKEKAKQLQLDCQRVAVQYQRANAVHQAARETIALAEERFANLREREKENGRDRKFDAPWQEMLNHATMKVMEAEAQKSASEREHQKRAAAYTLAENELQELQRRLKNVISKSHPYFNHKAATQIKLEAQKDKIYKLQKDVTLAKNKYSLSLRNLEHISEEIHELRRMNMKREPGVGAEGDQCVAFIEKVPSHESLVDSNTDEEHEYWNNLKEKLNQLKESPDPIDFSTSPFSTEMEREMNEKFSILVRKDDLSISYKDPPGNIGKRKEIMPQLKDSSGPIKDPAIAEEGRITLGQTVISTDCGVVDESERKSKPLQEEENTLKIPIFTIPDIIIDEKECNLAPEPNAKPSTEAIPSEKDNMEEPEQCEVTPNTKNKTNFVLNAVMKIEGMLSNEDSRLNDYSSEVILKSGNENDATL